MYNFITHYLFEWPLVCLKPVQPVQLANSDINKIYQYASFLLNINK